MKNILLVIGIVILLGCETVQTTANWPDSNSRMWCRPAESGKYGVCEPCPQVGKNYEVCFRNEADLELWRQGLLK
jgi:hypothetical protein